MESLVTMLRKFLPRPAPSDEAPRTPAPEIALLARERDAALEALRTEVAKREQAESALLHSQRLEAVGQLTGGIAHDFNNLLQAIAGNLELIARKPDDCDSVVRWSASALDALERARAVTAQLLAFSGRQRSGATPVRLAELVGGMRGLLERAVAPLSHVQVEPIDPTWNVMADPLQLELALLNLAFNARDAMPSGGTVTLSAARRTGAVGADLPVGEYLALTLADAGTGMSPAVLARAAEPFFTTKSGGEGTGMGLSMASDVARQLGGALLVDSEEGRGTSITILLRVAAGEPARTAHDDSARDRRVDLSGCLIALVDDDAQVRATLAETLANAGARVVEAGSGQEGVALVRETRPHLLIMDFAMPGMSGAEAARLVREADTRLPLLLVTGLTESPDLKRVSGTQVEVLKKPFDARELLRRAGALIGR